MSDVTVRMSRADEWRQRRALRLEMLADTPLAFGDRLSIAEQYTDDEWRTRSRRAVQSGNCSAVAVATDGHWVGTMGAFVDGDGSAVLVTVYVSPRHRGRRAGVADRLLHAVEQWVAVETDAAELTLWVHADNPVAISFYRRHGFTPTGRSHPYPLDRSQLELQFTKTLGQPPVAEPASGG